MEITHTLYTGYVSALVNYIDYQAFLFVFFSLVNVYTISVCVRARFFFFRFVGFFFHGWMGVLSLQMTIINHYQTERARSISRQ